MLSDSDWEGDRDTRRSRSGGVALLANCAVKSWSNRHATQALTSAEAQYHTTVKASAEALGIQALTADLGWGGAHSLVRGQQCRESHGLSEWRRASTPHGGAVRVAARCRDAEAARAEECLRQIEPRRRSEGTRVPQCCTGAFECVQALFRGPPQNVGSGVSGTPTLPCTELTTRDCVE